MATQSQCQLYLTLKINYMPEHTIQWPLPIKHDSGVEKSQIYLCILCVYLYSIHVRCLIIYIWGIPDLHRGFTLLNPTAFRTSHIQYLTKVPLNASKWLEQLKSNHRETLKGRKLMSPSEELWRNTRRETPVYTEPQGIIENNEQRLSALILKFS